MTAIMLYILILSCAIAIAAAMAERATPALALPSRYVWLVALLASPALPLLGLTIGGPAGGMLAVESAAFAIAGNTADEEPVTDSATEALGPSGIDRQQWTAWSDWAGWQLVKRTTGPAAAAIDGALATIWIAGSAVVLLAYLMAWVAVRRALRRWPRAWVADTEVAISDRVGPAVFGLRQPRIIVPRWLLAESGRMQATVIRHEQAHTAAKDTWWLAAATFTVALIPWNPVMWWQLHRLRTAIELDCDARVVRGGTDPESYAQVLVTVAQHRAVLRRPLALLGAVGVTGRRSQLERRVRQLLVRPTPHRLTAILGGACAALVLAAAWMIEPPAIAQTIDASADSEQPDETRIARQPLTGLAIGGERIAVLVDVSAGMLDRTPEGVQRWLEDLPESRRHAPKWTHLVETVETMTAQIPSGAQFQVILFDEDARAALPGTDGQWLTATPEVIGGNVEILRSATIPDGRSSLRAAFDAASALEPPPDIIHLIVDGLPTADHLLDAGAGSEYQQMHQLEAAIESVPPDAVVNVVLMPREGDLIAAAAYWVLTQRTAGSLFAPVEGATQSAVPGIPLETDYLVFVVDTSGSMQHFAWHAVVAHLRTLFDLHPAVQGIQVLTDMGEPLFSSYRDTWIPDTPDTRQDTIDAVREWRAFSNSTPYEGIRAALDLPYEAGSHVALYVYGDDLAIGQIDGMLEQFERLNRRPGTEAPRMQINAIALPAILEATGELHSSAPYAMLMRELSLRTGGAFIAPPN